MPKGWQVTSNEYGTAPPDWHTDAPKAGYVVRGSSGVDTFSIYFLPGDWIGIRKRLNSEPRHTYWEGILVGDGLVTITASSHNRFHDEFQLASSWRMTPSLTNGGFGRSEELFLGRRKLVDATAQTLVRRHCRTSDEFVEAAHSLLVLGVPAKSVFLRAVREAPEMDQQLFCSALGHFGGTDAIYALCDVLADPRISDYTRKYAAMALRNKVGPELLPAFRAAARQVRQSPR